MISNEYILAVLAFIIFLLFLFFACFLLTVKTNKKTSNLFLALFLIVTAIDISVFFYSLFLEINLNADMFRNRLSDLKNPLLFLYILSVIYANFQLKKKHLIHLVPWLMGLLILLPNFFLADIASKIKFLNSFDTTTEAIILNKTGVFISIAYLLASVYYVVRYRKLLLENYTDSTSFKNYNWLKQLLLLILLGVLLTTIKGFVRDNEYPSQIIATWRITTLLFGVVFVFWLILKAMNSPKLFRGIDVNLTTSKEMKHAQENTDRTNNQITDLKDYMHTQKPYLDSSLTIKKLAQEMNMSMRDLSVLINQDLQQHFFDFINEYRIKNAMEILKNPSKNKLTILEILYEVGFNSKSSFNTAFKKHVNLTPTQFRKDFKH